MAGMKKDPNPEKAGVGKESPAEEIDSCGLCSALFSKNEEKSSRGGTGKPSGGPWRFMTEREFSVLKAMRSLRDKAVKIKKRIRAIEKELGSGPRTDSKESAGNDRADEVLWEQQMAEELLYHCDRLTTLKQQWSEMDMERMAAQEERMRLLGHIQ